MKKNIAKLLVFAMLLTMIPFTSAATPNASGGGGGGSSKPTVGSNIMYEVISDVSVSGVAANVSCAASDVTTNSKSSPYKISVDVSSDKVSNETELTVSVHCTTVNEGVIYPLESAGSSIPTSGGSAMTFTPGSQASPKSTLSTKLDLSDVKTGGTKHFGLAIKVSTSGSAFYMVYYRLTVKVTPAEPAEGSTYAVNAYALPRAGGTVEASVKEAKAGDTVTLTFRANAGYEFTFIDFFGFEDECCPSTPADGQCVFTMPEGDFDIFDVRVQFKPANALVQPDIYNWSEGEATVVDTDPAFKTLSPDIKQQVNDAVKLSSIAITENQLEDEALTMANTAASNSSLVEKAKADLHVDNYEDIQFIAKPVMTITPKNYISGEKPILTLDIKGYIKVFAEPMDYSKSIEVGEPQPITNKPVEICISLPFTVPENLDYNCRVAFAAHKGMWQYWGGVTEDNSFVFLNPHGFSEFKIGIEDKTVVFNERIEHESFYTYLTFAAAAEEAVKGDVLILEEDNAEHVTLPAGVTVKLLDTNVKFTGTINGQSVTLSTNGYTVPSSSSNSGGGGGGGGSSKPAIKPGEQTKPTTPGTTTPSGGVAGFTDVAAGAWYADSIQYVVDKGLFGGVGNGNFAPNANMTRAMMWTVLARYMGVNTNTGSNWYEAARAWAIEKGISDGTMAEGNVTREQFVTMLWRLSGEPAVTKSASFTDGGKVSAYAKTAVDWAVEQGIVNGYNDGTFKPQGSATRAEVAKMLTVFCQNADNASSGTAADAG